MSRLRKKMPVVALLLVLAGLVYTLSLDSSAPVVIVEETDGPAPEAQEVLDTTTYHDITYTVGSIGLHFALNEEGHWIWQDDVSFPLNEQWITQLAQDLEGLSYLRSIPLSDDNPIDNYGLEEPWGSLVAQAQDGTTLQLFFGNAGTDGDTYYMLKDGDMDRALVYTNDWMDMLDMPIYDMMVLPQLPSMSASTVKRVDVVGGETTLVLYPEYNTDGTVVWKHAGEEEGDNYPSLMGTVIRLKLVSCFSYKPSEEAVAICGFDTPAAMVTIAYGEQEEELAYVTMAVGGLAADPAYRYVRVDDDPTIYLIEEESASVFLALLEA